MLWTEFITTLKDTTPLDIITYIILLLLSGQSIWTGFLRKKKSEAEDARLPLHVMTMAEVDKLLTEKYFIVHIQTMKSQMKLVETAIESTKRDLKDSFFKELQNKGMESAVIISSIDYSHYSACVEIMGERMREDVRTMMRENGLPKRNELEMRIYIQSKNEQLQDMAARVFDVYYQGTSFVLSRSDLHDFHMGLITRQHKRFDDVIRECRSVAVEGENRLKEIETRLEFIKTHPCGTAAT